MNDVVITGAAAIGPHGSDLDRLQQALQEGRPLAVEMPPNALSPAPIRVRSTVRGAVPDGDLSPWITRLAARRMSRASQWTIAAGKMALPAARHAPADPEQLAVCVATCFGAADFTSQLLRQILREGPAAASPFLFTDSVANAPGGQLAIATGARGTNATICQREAGPLLALIHAAAEIRHGRAATALVAAVDEIDAAQFAILDRMGALARSADELRPFDHRRRGILLGEGAAALVLEAESDAIARGAPLLARVRMGARAFDPTASRSSWGLGEAALAAHLAGRLSAANITLDSIDLVVSGASGARDGDRVEAGVLRHLFAATAATAAPIPPVLVPKAVLGEYGGGTLVPALLALRGGGRHYRAPVHATEPDPELGIRAFEGELPHRIRRILLSALASGGAAAWVILDAPDRPDSGDGPGGSAS